MKFNTNLSPFDNKTLCKCVRNNLLSHFFILTKTLSISVHICRLSCCDIHVSAFSVMCGCFVYYILIMYVCVLLLNNRCFLACITVVTIWNDMINL